MPSDSKELLMFQNTVNKFHPQWEHLVLYYKFDQEMCIRDSHKRLFFHCTQKVLTD